ncbi:DUF4062 domain-containing protein [Acinetobacter sp. SM34]|uniref:DUF4062 domain-containing protein n=1 Tax=Acinetobacter sp. SM34 TaxID=1301620 RepID=UPI001EDB3785|nr:DUF4062 domain-containing protein [Acinetobacter sp. SM34]MCG2607144.1 DUF4062 domain-containing protein [Acinetobacter sp. SM34]
MAYQATILNVMIASPSDVAEERQLIRDAIYEWNAIHSKQFGVMLNPVGWENNVAPQMGSRPQEIINKRILNNSDILLAIFWTRLGTETGEYVSGTVEEIYKHCENNKLTSIYISKKSYPDNIDLEQLQLLRDQTQIWLKEGLLDFYDNHSLFKQKIKDHLSLHIQHNEYIQTIINELNSNDTPIETSTKQTIEPSDEMIQLIINAGEAESEIQFISGIDCTNLYAGALKLNLDTPRKIATWKSTLHELETLGLIQDEYDGKLFSLTQQGWKAFDQLKEQQQEK